MIAGVDTAPKVTLSGIQAALDRIRDAITVSPCACSSALSTLTGSRVYLKLENLQRTGAYKERGALNKLLLLAPEERHRGLITASAGNHAQALAYHSGKLGIRAEIWMPLTTPLVKVSATRQYGAEVVLHGTNFDEAYQGAQEHSQKTGANFVHPFDDESVIAGQGTLALEVLQQVPDLETVIVPVGGGGLISGMAVALKEVNRSIRVIGVQTAVLPSMVVALREKRPVQLPGVTTLADGIAVRTAGQKTLPLVQKYVDDIVVVDEEEIANAVLFLLEREKTLVEGAGACGVASLLHRKVTANGRVTAVIVTGGNMDVNLLARIIERGLVKSGRLVRLRIVLPDHPGALHQLTNVIANHHVNIVETSYHRAFYGASLGHTVIDLTMETRGPEHSDELIEALRRAGYNHERIL